MVPEVGRCCNKEWHWFSVLDVYEVWESKGETFWKIEKLWEECYRIRCPCVFILKFMVSQLITRDTKGKSTQETRMRHSQTPGTLLELLWYLLLWFKTVFSSMKLPNSVSERIYSCICFWKYVFMKVYSQCSLHSFSGCLW